jgi:hypothetical protein
MTTATLSWTDPTARTDGTALSPSEISTIDIFDDIGDGKGPQKIGSVTGAGTSFTTGTLAVATHTFTAIVNDTTGHSSATSNAVQLIVAATLAAPNPVANLTAAANP